LFLKKIKPKLDAMTLHIIFYFINLFNYHLYIKVIGKEVPKSIIHKSQWKYYNASPSMP